MSDKKTLVVHNERFHADDLFAGAAMQLLFGVDLEIIRSRDPGVIEKADIVADVGHVYDPEKLRFDHHQEGGAGERENGIPYSAIGLIWKHFGEEICGSRKAADNIDERLIQLVDAEDVAVNAFTPNFGQKVFDLDVIADYFSPSWNEDQENGFDAGYFEALPFYKRLLERVIKKEQDKIEATEIVEEIYNQAEDKRYLVMDKYYPTGRFLDDKPETLYILYPSPNKTWRIKAVKKDKETYDNRKDFPEGWGGKRDEELQQETGISDALFCHSSLWLCGAVTKEGALELVKIALEN